MNRVLQRIEDVEKMKLRNGRKQYLKFLRGERVTRDEAIKAKCYDCCNGEDFHPCRCSTCALIPFCPYGRSDL